MNVHCTFIFFLECKCCKTGKWTKRKPYTKLDFSLEEEEQLFDYVKSNSPLYDPQNENYKNKMFRDRLWDKFGETIEKSGNLSI